MNAVQSNHLFIDALKSQPFSLEQVSGVTVHEGLQVLFENREELLKLSERNLRRNCFVWLHSFDGKDSSTHAKISTFVLSVFGCEIFEEFQLLSRNQNPLQSAHVFVLAGDEVNLRRVLKSHSIDVNDVINDNGDTLLTLAASRGFSGAIEILIQQPNIDPNQPQVQRIVPDFAVGREEHYASLGLLERISLIIKTPLGIAVEMGCVDTVLALLKHPNTNPDLETHRGRSALLLAAMKGDFEMVEILLNASANPNCPFEKGTPPLCAAATDGNVKILQILLAHPLIDPNQKNIYDHTPLFLAVLYSLQNGTTEPVRLLLDHKDTDPNQRAMLGHTPLYIASALGGDAIVDLFLQHPKTDPNYTSELAHSTPLGIAVTHNRSSILAKMLGNKGVDRNMGAPLLKSISHGCREAMELLVNDPQTDLFPRETEMARSPFISALSSSSEEIRQVNNAPYPVSEDDPTLFAEWTKLSFLPVSNDLAHRPPTEYLDEIEFISPRLARNHFGEVEVFPFKERNVNFLRVVYTTEEFMTISILRNNRPIGPTLYRPLICISQIDTALADSSQKNALIKSSMIWHISNKTISQDSHTVNAMLQKFAAEGLMVFRSLNNDHDRELLLNERPLKGRGTNRKVKDHVEGRKNTVFVSASMQPMSKFVKNSGGFVAIFTEKGAKQFLGFQDDYPKRLTHEQTLNEVSDNPRLTNRVREAKETLFTTPIPLEIIALLDDGFPSSRISSISEKTSVYSVPLDVKKLLKKERLNFEELPDYLKKILCSNKKLKYKREVLVSFIGKSASKG